MQRDGDSADGGWYRLGRLLESTPSADVHETSRPGLPGPCAIKILRPVLTDRIDSLPDFRADVEAVAALRHPNILQVIEVGSRPDVPAFVVTERLQGQLLSERLNEKRKLPMAEVLAVVKGAAAGLQAAHHIGVVHGELNPGNVFLARPEGYDQDMVKLLDFGIARLRPLDAAASLSSDTIRYLSPEQASGRLDEIDGRSDQFALALIVYRMLTGRDAYRGDSAVSLLYEIVHGHPTIERISTGGAAVESVIRCALTKDRRLRFESVTAFRRALAEAVGAEVTKVAPRPEEPRPRTPKPVVVAAAAVAAPAPAPVVPAAPVVAAAPVVVAAPVVAPAPVAAAAPVFQSDRDLFTHPFFETPPPRRLRRRRPRIIFVRRSQGGRLALLMLGVVVASLAGSLAVGWRPPLEWRQSPLWHQLRLPWGETAESSPGD